jgi:hypothetical protein
VTAMRLALLIAAAVLAGCRPGVPAHVDPALAAFIPDDAVVLAGVRLERLKATPAGKQMAAAGLLQPAGVEARDLLACWDGKNWLVAARGSLRSPASPTLAAVGDVVLAGTEEAVRAAIARQANPGRPPRELLDRARSVPPDSQIWVVTYGAPALPEAVGSFAPIARLIGAMEDITASADLRDGIDAAAAGNCLDERNARVVEETLRGLIGLGRLTMSRRDPEVERAWDGFQVEREGRTVRLKAAISQDAAEKLAAVLSAR